MARAAPTAWLVASLATFVTGAWSMARALAVSINSDALYLDGLYRDIFVDRVPVRGWTVQPAPSFFPDLPLLFALRTLTGNSVVANCAYGVSELVIEAVLIAALFRALGARRSSAWCAALLTAGAFAYRNAIGDYNHLLFYPSTHSSCVWVGLACALLAARQYERRRLSAWAAAGLVALTALTAGSDDLYLLVGAGPIVAASLGCAVMFPVNRRVAMGCAVATGLGIVLSSSARRLPNLLGMQVPPKGFDLIISGARVRQAIANWPPPDHQPGILRLQLTLVAAGMTLALWIATRSYRERRPAGRARRHEAAFLAVAFLASMTFTVGGVTFGGFYWDRGSARYLQPTYVYPDVIVGAWFCLASSRVLRLLAATSLWCIVQPWPRLSPVQNQATRSSLVYPPAVACIDGVADRYGAPYGYGDYWNARRTTELSRAKLRILPVADAFTMYSWIANWSWFSLGTKASSSFLLLPNRLDENSVRAKLGPPERAERCAEETVWVYADPPRERPQW